MYNLVWWIDLQSPAVITQAYEELLQLMMLDINEDVLHQFAAHHVLRGPLFGDWLIVYDNVPEVDLIPWLETNMGPPRKGQIGHIVVSHSASVIATNTHDALFESSSRLCTKDKVEMCLELQDVLGANTDAWHIATAYIQHSGMRIESYMTALNFNCFVDPVPALRSLSDTEKLLSMVTADAFEYVVANCREARVLTFALLLIEYTRFTEFEVRSGPVRDPMRCFQQLLELRLFTQHMEEDVVVYSTTDAVYRALIPLINEASVSMACSNLIRSSLQTFPSLQSVTTKLVTRQQQALPHVMSLVSKCSHLPVIVKARFSDIQESAVSLALNAARATAQMGEHQATVEILQFALPTIHSLVNIQVNAVSLFIKGTIELMRSLVLLGNVMPAQQYVAQVEAMLPLLDGEYELLVHFHHCIGLWQVASGNTQQGFLAMAQSDLIRLSQQMVLPDSDMYNIDFSLAHAWTGRESMGVNISTKATRNMLAKTHPNLVAALTSQSILRAQIGQYDKSLSVIEQAIDYVVTTYGEPHAGLAPLYAIKAEALCYLGQHDDCRVAAQKSIDIYALAYENKNSHMSNALRSMALSLQLSGRYAEALLTLNHAVDIVRELGVYSHPDTAYLLVRIGELHLYVGDLQESARFFNAAIEMFNDTSGVLVPRALRASAGLSVVAAFGSDYDTALQIAVKAIRASSELAKRHTSLLLSMIREHTSHFTTASQPIHAMSAAALAVSVAHALYGSQSAKVIGDVLIAASVSASCGDYDRALDYAKHAEAVATMQRVVNHTSMVNIHQTFASIHLHRNDRVEAAKAQQSACNSLSKVLGGLDPQVLACLNALNEINNNAGAS